MSDQYQWWRDALAGNAADIHADEPQSGYYKMRRGKNNPWLPVAIWVIDGQQYCRVGQDNKAAGDVWTYCAGNPVSKVDAKHAFEHGSWPGDVAIGHNSGDLALSDEITDVCAQATEFLNKTGIVDTVTKDKAANYRARLQELAKKADKERDEKKRPHDEAAKAVQKHYKPMIDSAEAAALMLRTALSRYMADEEEKARKIAAETARVENERRMAEHKRQQDEATRAAAEAKANGPPLPIEIPLFVAPEPVKVTAGGQHGKKTGLREVKRYALSDYAAALAHAKDHPDVIAAVEKVCFAQARAGATVPGVTSTIEKVAV